MRFYGLLAIFLMFTQASQAAPGDVFNSLVEQTNSSRRPEASVDQSCGEAGKKEFVRIVADAWYLWYDELAQVSPDEFDTAQAYLNALTAPLAPDGRDPGFSYLTHRLRIMPRAAPVLMSGLGFVMVLIFKIAFYFRMFYKVAPQVMPIYKGGTKY